MKYIKIIDKYDQFPHILPVIEETKDTYVCDLKLPDGSIPKSLSIPVKKESVNAIADTIPELCDRFVIVFEDGNYLIYDEFEWALDKAARMKDVKAIYGAIFTSAGLIYVAKMNDKGELELI